MDSDDISSWLLAMVRDILGPKSNPRLEDNFVEIEGNSFGAVMLAAAIDERFEVIVDLNVFFQSSLADVVSTIAAERPTCR